MRQVCDFLAVETNVINQPLTKPGYTTLSSGAVTQVLYIGRIKSVLLYQEQYGLAFLPDRI